ncbi:hypothetical protein MSG28_000705 [Choristoneura fumiferana]|uniref:Uncharacterized protein n=1 Tax=Choristoneura fumiferana TaxID=7141 RepID=A0ACC0K220_CHOFU|nr:hypothetical protein MSG28_000705 [Choristoneura fumiferana]
MDSKSPQPLISSRVVRTKYGDIRGFIVTPESRFLEPVEVFRGIPYASSPVGSLRFMPPVSGAQWSGVKIAEEFSPVCPQVLPDIRNETAVLKRISKGRLEYLKRILPFLTNQAEDCLHATLNDIIRRALSTASVLTTLEPSGLSTTDGKRPDGHVNGSARKPGSAAEQAQTIKCRKYAFLSNNYIFAALAIETLGPWSSDTKKFVKEVSNKLFGVSGDHRAGTFFAQRLSLAVQRGNAASVLGTMPQVGDLQAGVRDAVARYPVLVFVHGESYEWSSGNAYDGSVLASHAGLVVVTINYRLGILALRLRSNATQRLLQHAHCAPPLCSRDYPTKLTPAHNYPRFHHHYNCQILVYRHIGEKRSNVKANHQFILTHMDIIQQGNESDVVSVVCYPTFDSCNDDENAGSCVPVSVSSGSRASRAAARSARVAAAAESRCSEDEGLRISPKHVELNSI